MINIVFYLTSVLICLYTSPLSAKSAIDQLKHFNERFEQATLEGDWQNIKFFGNELVSLMMAGKQNSGNPHYMDHEGTHSIEPNLIKEKPFGFGQSADKNETAILLRALESLATVGLLFKDHQELKDFVQTLETTFNPSTLHPEDQVIAGKRLDILTHFSVARQVYQGKAKVIQNQDFSKEPPLLQTLYAATAISQTPRDFKDTAYQGHFSIKADLSAEGDRLKGLSGWIKEVHTTVKSEAYSDLIAQFKKGIKPQQVVLKDPHLKPIVDAYTSFCKQYEAVAKNKSATTMTVAAQALKTLKSALNSAGSKSTITDDHINETLNATLQKLENRYDVIGISDALLEQANIPIVSVTSEALPEEEVSAEEDPVEAEKKVSIQNLLNRFKDIHTLSEIKDLLFGEDLLEAYKEFVAAARNDTHPGSSDQTSLKTMGSVQRFLGGFMEKLDTYAKETDLGEPGTLEAYIKTLLESYYRAQDFTQQSRETYINDLTAGARTYVALRKNSTAVAAINRLKAICTDSDFKLIDCMNALFTVFAESYESAAAYFHNIDSLKRFFDLWDIPLPKTPFQISFLWKRLPFSQVENFTTNNLINVEKKDEVNLQGLVDGHSKTYPADVTAQIVYSLFSLSSIDTQGEFSPSTAFFFDKRGVVEDFLEATSKPPSHFKDLWSHLDKPQKEAIITRVTTFMNGVQDRYGHFHGQSESSASGQQNFFITDYFTSKNTTISSMVVDWSKIEESLKVLGLEPTMRDKGAIKKQYYKLAQKYHPDTSIKEGPPKADGGEFAAISQAYAFLMNELPN